MEGDCWQRVQPVWSFKSAESVGCSFCCDPEGKQERGPASLATPRPGELPKGLGWGEQCDQICVFKVSYAAEEKGCMERARRTCGRPAGRLLSKWEMAAAWEGDGKKRPRSIICKTCH